MCPYTLPILQFPYPFSSLCLSCNLSSSLRSLQSLFVVILRVVSILVSEPISSSSLSPKEDKVTISEKTFLKIEKAKILLKECSVIL